MFCIQFPCIVQVFSWYVSIYVFLYLCSGIESGRVIPARFAVRSLNTGQRYGGINPSGQRGSRLCLFFECLRVVWFCFYAFRLLLCRRLCPCIYADLRRQCPGGLIYDIHQFLIFIQHLPGGVAAGGDFLIVEEDKICFTAFFFYIVVKRSGAVWNRILRRSFRHCDLCRQNDISVTVCIQLCVDLNEHGAFCQILAGVELHLIFEIKVAGLGHVVRIGLIDIVCIKRPGFLFIFLRTF